MPENMDNAHRYFATTVGLITTKGSKHGQNVMAAEWTMHIAYEPMLIAIFVHDSPTYWNIKETRVFGVNLASEDQAELVNIAGGYSGIEIEKLAIPRTFSTYGARHIDVPMIKGCSLNAECKVTKIEKIGDHIMVVGEALSAKFDEKKFPLIYTRGNYRKLSKSKIPSGRKAVRVTGAQMSQFKKMSAGQFVLKAAAAIIRNDNKILLQKFGNSWILPVVVVGKGAEYKETLAQYLHSVGISACIDKINRISRMILKTSETELRANFVVFDCKLEVIQGSDVAWFVRLPKNVLLRILLEKP
ncbi:MAG TPA: flavin reductase family protein [Nitrososphaera sp.]|jgi:flavin reductase (DIM6/NTAB) family NADH-FMN oxidoreductase RutF|nr:flavin reductase family protein [Nitrososphaera sp.]